MSSKAAGVGSRWAGLALAALLLLLGLPTLLFPYGRDQAMFAYVGQVWREGGLPYRDAWDVKLPAIYAVYALVGGVSWGPRLLDLCAVAVGSFALVWLARTVGSGQWAVECTGGRDRWVGRRRQHPPQSPLGQGGSSPGAEAGGVSRTTSPPQPPLRRREGEFGPPTPNPGGLSAEVQDGGGVDIEREPSQRPRGALLPFECAWPDWVALLAVGLLGVFTFGALDYWNLAQTETLIGPLAALAVAAGLGGRPLLAGLLVGLAVCFKTTAVLFVLPVGGQVFGWSGVRVFGCSGVRKFVLGVGQVPVGFVAYFAARGGLPFLWELVRVQAEYAGGDPRTAGLSPLELVRALGLGSYLPLVAASAVALIPWLRDRSVERSVRWTVALWWAVALLQIGVQRRFYLYHWSVLTPAAAWLAAYGMWRLWGWRAGSWRGEGGTLAAEAGAGWREDLTPLAPLSDAERGEIPSSGRGEGSGVNPLRLPLGKGESSLVESAVVWRVVAVGVLLLGVATPGLNAIARIPEAMGVVSGKVGVEAYQRGFGGVFDYSVAEGMDVGRHVAARSGVGDRVLVLGFEPHVYLYAGRRAPSRHASDAPLFGEKSIREGRRRAWLRELMGDLERNPPLYYVEWEPPAVIARPEWARVLSRFRFRYYREEGKYGRFRVYRRRGRAEG